LDGTCKKILNDKYQIYLAAIGIGAEDSGGKAVSWEEGLASPGVPLFRRQGIRKEAAATGPAGSRPTGLSVSIPDHIQGLSMNEIRAGKRKTGLRILYRWWTRAAGGATHITAENANFLVQARAGRRASRL
jgi:hypothetical protein